MEKELEERLIDLEIKFSYQSELLDSLNLVVIEQQQDISSLKDRLQKLGDTKSGSQDAGIKNLADEVPPPHY